VANALLASACKVDGCMFILLKKNQIIG
ncbi:ASFV_G_ACD_00070, partial [African swine fever virus]